MNSLPKTVKYPDMPPGYSPLFPWASDKVTERRATAEAIEAYIGSLPQETGVIAINGRWGSGKTLFLRMWRDSLLAKGKPCVYFNAWEHDFVQSPVFSLLAILENEAADIEDKTPPDDDDDQSVEERTRRQAIAQAFRDAHSKVASLAKTAWRLTYRIGHAAAPATASFLSGVAATQAGCDPQTAQHVADAANRFAAGALPSPKSTRNDGDATGLEVLKEATLSLRSMEEFRCKLKEYRASLCDENTPLIIMVDDLDRCRPDYAISLLEEIKHLFSVPGVYFILATEKEQLANCIKARYGLNDKAEFIYLDKFIDLTIDLPVPTVRQIIGTLTWHSELSQTRMQDELVSFAEKYTPALTFRGIAQALVKFAFVRAQTEGSRELQVTAAFLLLLAQTGCSLEESENFILTKGIQEIEQIIAKKLDWRASVLLGVLIVYMRDMVDPGLFDQLRKIEPEAMNHYRSIMRDPDPPRDARKHIRRAFGFLYGDAWARRLKAPASATPSPR